LGTHSGFPDSFSKTFVNRPPTSWPKRQTFATVWQAFAGFCEEKLGIGPETLLKAHFGTDAGTRQRN
jgi:hypothetical protein